MSSVQVRLLDDKRLRQHLEKLFIGNVEELVQAYLDILPADKGGEGCGSYRQIAADELAGFVAWLKAEMELDDQEG